MSRCWPTRSGSWASDHPDTLATRNNLASAYLDAGRTAEAITLHEQTLADRERVLGADHPDTLPPQQPRQRLPDAGRTAEAITLHEQNLADRERVLGADHPDTLATRNNLANAYQDAGRTAEAITLHEQTLADRERLLGADHPDTLATRNNLANAYQDAGRTAEAITLHEQTLADRERVWAPTTPTPWPRATTSPAPTWPRAAPPRRSPCTSRTWPTGSGCWAPTILTP